MKEKQRILNDRIRANKVQLIDDQGESLGLMTLNEAKIKAEGLNLDLMEMSKNRDCTIVKMLDYGKFLYRLKKHDRKNKVKGKAPDLKTLRITFKISEHDLEIRKKQAEKFAIAGHPLKITLMLRGRENHYSDLALDKMTHFIDILKEVYKADNIPKKTGNTFSVMLKPIK